MTQVELASFQVSRRALPWLLAAVVAALLPHALHLPPWLTAVALLCLGWRIAVHRGRLSYPPRRLQALFAVLLLAGTFLHYRTFAGHEAGTAMLVAMFSLKLLEMYKERDAYVVILIGYFVAAMAFLFFFSVWMAFYVLGVAILFTAALVAINASLDMPAREPLLRASSLVLQSIPIAILLFVVMPRLGPLWSVGLKPGEASTGIGEVVNPGDIGKLGRSAALAFRVEFEGEIPVLSRMYWRGLTLEVFDGRSWRQSHNVENYPELTWYPGVVSPPWRERLLRDREQGAPGSALRYSVMLEPTQRPWLFALAVPWTGGQRDIGLVYDQRLRSRQPVKTLVRYDVTSVPQPRDLAPSRWLLAENLELPDAGNPQARQWALQQRAESADEEAFARRVLQYFRDEQFFYTLTPPLLGEHSVDEFLFASRRGFCEHYASAFAFVMRAAGIPARVVAGYQGGEVNPLNGIVQVRQYDAHAWAEIWLEGRGWVEYDPTAAVAPQRIERGARAAVGDEAEFLADAPLAELLSSGGVLSALGDALDYLNHGWNKWVLNYDEQTQQGFLKRLLGRYSPWRIGLVLLGIGVLVGGLLVLWLFRESLFRREPPVAREYRLFCAAWAQRGHARLPGEGPRDYGQRLGQVDPRRAVAVQHFIAIYTQLAYGGRPVDAAVLRQLREARARAA